jgi:hypothetical protein
LSYGAVAITGLEISRFERLFQGTKKKRLLRSEFSALSPCSVIAAGGIIARRLQNRRR